MANPVTSVLLGITNWFKNNLFSLILWVAISLGAGIVAAQYISDSVTLLYISAGTALTLLFWWFILAWNQKSRWLLDLQEFLIAHKMLPFHFTRLKRSMPWSLSMDTDKLLRNCAGEYNGLQEKIKESTQTLEKYLGANVLDKAAKKAGQSELGGELRRVYVLFSDIRGFTHMTETIRPEETVEILNQMFTAMEEVIRQHGGDINKYIGDAILAYFRRPYGNEGEPAKLVLRAALRMQDRFEVLNKSFKVAYSQPLTIGLGIGITAGQAIMGNLGSANRMEFTLIGDTVNMASRLCGVAKHGQILVNEELANICKNNFELTALPPMQIKGKTELQVPYAVIGEQLSLGR